MRSTLRRAALLAWIAAGACQLVQAEPRQPLYDQAQRDKDDAIKLLQRLVNVDSGTYNAKGLNQVGAIALAELKQLGAHIESLPAAPAQGRNILASWTGGGTGRILLVAHMDTVFADGTAAAHPFRIEGARAYGPGVMDDKGGMVAGLYAVKLLRQLHFNNFGKISLLLNTNEETGSAGTRALIEQLARQHDVAFNLEPGRAADGLVVWRKGSAELELEIRGKAAHAGVAPETGRNAAMEAAHQVLQLSHLDNADKQSTVNFTVLKAGERSNVIPDYAIAEADVRVAVAEEFGRIEQDLIRISADRLIPETQVKASLRISFPPMPKSAATDALADRAQSIYGELGRKLTLEGSGGASDASLMAAAGTPTIDGLGIVGGGIHTPDEYAELDSVVPRLYLLARLLMEFGPGK